jgi:hypothetical protein
MRKRIVLMMGALGTTATIAACSSASAPTATPQSVKTKASTYASALTAHGQAALDALGSLSSTSALENGLAPLADVFGGSSGTLSTVSEQTTSFLRSQRSVRSFARLRSASALGTGSSPSATLEQYLAQRVFTDANVESSGGGSVTYRIQGDDMCPYRLQDGSLSLLHAEGAVLDTGCAADLDKLELRVRASEPAADALDLTLMFGPAGAAPLTIELRPSSAAAVISLPGVKGLLEFARTFDVDVAVPGTMNGAVDLKLTVNRIVDGKPDVTFSSSVRETVQLELQRPEGTISFTTAARTPWYSLQANAIDRAVATSVDLGPTTVSAPYDTLSASWKQETTTLGGLSFSFAAQEGQAAEFAITNIGLGDEETHAFLDSEKVMALNLSPRRFGVSFKADPDAPGRTIFTFDPVTLTVFSDGRPYGNTDPAAAGRTYTWTLAAASGKPQVEPYRYTVPVACGASCSYQELRTALKAVNGTLQLSDGALSVEVAQGQCLLESGAASPSSLIEEYVSGACPP